MSWENILKYGYGLLHLTPEQLYEIDIRDFVDMVNGALMWHRDTENELYDTVMEQLSHFFANVMLSSGNYKKGTKLEKIRESLYIPVEAESCEMSRESLMSASSRAIESARILSAKAIESS